MSMFIKEGMNDFVAKPIEVRVLVTKIRQWLPKEKVRKRSISVKKEAKPKSTLPQIPGLNVEDALKLVGSEKLFMDILKDYYTAIPKKARLIQSYKDNQEWHNYTIEVHALKSASKQIGAYELSDKAAALEAAGNAGDTDMIQKDTDSLLELYLHYIEVLAPIFPDKQDSEDKTPISVPVLMEAFDEIAQAINDLDMDQMDATVQKLDNYQFDEEGAKFYERLCEAVSDMDPDACEEVISQWKDNL